MDLNLIEVMFADKCREMFDLWESYQTAQQQTAALASLLHAHGRILPKMDGISAHLVLPK